MKHKQLLVWLLLALYCLTSCRPSDADQPSLGDEVRPSSSQVDETLVTPVLTTTPEIMSATPEAMLLTATPEVNLLTGPPAQTQTLFRYSEMNADEYSDEVLGLEQRLQSLGFSETGIIDGVFDHQTTLAVEHLQWMNHLPVTGGVTPELYSQIMSGDLAPIINWPPPFPAKSLSQYGTPQLDLRHNCKSARFI